MHRDFDAELEERAREREPVTFTLRGEEWQLRTSIAFGNIVAIALANKQGDEASAIAASRDLIVSSVVPDQRDDFESVVDDLDMDTVLDLTKWIVETVTGRPTEPPSASRAGRKSSGGTSTSKRGGKGSAR